jgi:hypothetical protein
MFKRVGVLFGCCGLVGCSMWLEVDAPQCKVNQDCVGLFGRGYVCGEGGICSVPDAGSDPTKPQLPSRWQCANETPDGFVAKPDHNVVVRMDAVDLNTLRVPNDLIASACDPSDVTCSAPVISDVRPGSDGFLEFEVPYGFEGFLTFEAPGIVSSISWTNKPYLDTLTTSGPALLTTMSLDDLAEHAGHPIDPSMGVAILEMRDCVDAAGDGISLDPVADQEPFYFDGALPARGLPATMVSNLLGAGREARAVGGFSNLPPGYLSIQARLASNQAPIANVTIQIRPAQITYVRVYAGY